MVLILVGLFHLVAFQFESLLVRVMGIIGELFWVTLGVAYFVYHPQFIWLWRLLPIGFFLLGFVNSVPTGAFTRNSARVH